MSGSQPTLGQRGARVHCAAIVFAALTALLLAPATMAATCYVTMSGTGNGSSWADATDLQSALGDSSCTETWIKAGTYKPSSGSNRGVSFNIRPGVQVYGGFAGTESNRSARSLDPGQTILSGDIGTSGDDSDNSYHVVVMDGTTTLGRITTDTVLDGVTISGGNANGSTPSNGHGGGLYCDGQASVCSPTLNNIVFTGNDAIQGGAMYNNSYLAGASSPNLINITFSKNHAMQGGAIYNNGSVSGSIRPTLFNVSFFDNSATEYGGAIYSGSISGGYINPTLTHVVFKRNSAGARGGAMYTSTEHGVSGPSLSDVTFDANTTGGHGGAMYNYCGGGGNITPYINGATFSDNHAGQNGGAIYNLGELASASSPRLVNATFNDNQASRNGGAIYNAAVDTSTASPSLANVTFSGNRAGQNGGAMYNSERYGGNAGPHLTNVTFSNNYASARGGAMYNSGNVNGMTAPNLQNVIAWGDNAGHDSAEIHNTDNAELTIEYSVIEGGCNSGDGNTCSDIITSNPMLDSLADNGGSTETLLPGVGSSAIDTGNDSVCNATPVNGVDQRGVARPQGSHCDIGAVEVRPSQRLTVTINGSGTVSGGTTPAPVGGSIDRCSTTCSATYHEQSAVNLIATASTGSRIDMVSGCGGTLNGTNYTTAPISTPCTVAVNFARARSSYAAVTALGRQMLLLLATLLAVTAAWRLRRS